MQCGPASSPSTQASHLPRHAMRDHARTAAPCSPLVGPALLGVRRRQPHPVLGMHRFPLAVALEALFVVGAAAVATFYNAGLHSGADPYTLYDEQTGLYHAYSTSGQDPGWLFAIYTSPDLSTWTRRPGGAMQACTHNGTALQTGQVCWAKDWQVRMLQSRAACRSGEG